MSELRSSSIIRLCCAHVMHAFVRSLHQMKLKKDKRHQCTKLFAVLVNTNTLASAFDLFEKILIIYGDPNTSSTDKLLSHITDVTNVLDFDLQEFLKDEIDATQETGATEETLSVPIEDTLEASKAIIHKSPFTREARKAFILFSNVF